MFKKIKKWVDRERRFAKQIDVISQEPWSPQELLRIKDKIWRHVLLGLAQSNWISGIAGEGGECLFGKTTKPKSKT